jgi:hypothetical protein
LRVLVSFIDVADSLFFLVDRFPNLYIDCQYLDFNQMQGLLSI